MLFRSTEAGHAVVPLLKLAGLYVEYPERAPTVKTPEIDFSVMLKPRYPEPEATT